MSQIIAQRNGKYALFSRIVDDFVLLDATIEDLVGFRLDEQERIIRREVSRVIEVLKAGEKPYCQFTKSLDEAIEWITEMHGKDTESLNMLREAQGGEL